MSGMTINTKYFGKYKGLSTTEDTLYFLIYSNQVIPQAYAVVQKYPRLYKTQLKAQKGLEKLLKIGLIKKIRYTFTEAKEIMDREGYKKDKTCNWCGCKAKYLQKHHYPVPVRAKGKLTVDICDDCHKEFHFLTCM